MPTSDKVVLNKHLQCRGRRDSDKDVQTDESARSLKSQCSAYLRSTNIKKSRPRRYRGDKRRKGTVYEKSSGSLASKQGKRKREILTG